MRLHRFIRVSVSAACALAATACILIVMAATALAVPTENVGPRRTATPSVPTPTIVKETVVRSGGGTDVIVFVLIGVGAVAGMLGAGFTGARVATRATNARTGTVGTG